MRCRNCWATPMSELRRSIPTSSANGLLAHPAHWICYSIDTGPAWILRLPFTLQAGYRGRMSCRHAPPLATGATPFYEISTTPPDLNKASWLRRPDGPGLSVILAKFSCCLSAYTDISGDSSFASTSLSAPHPFPGLATIRRRAVVEYHKQRHPDGQGPSGCRLVAAREAVLLHPPALAIYR